MSTSAVATFKSLGVGGVTEVEHQVYLVISYPRAYLLRPLLVVQVERYGQAGSLTDQFARRIGRAERVV